MMASAEPMAGVRREYRMQGDVRRMGQVIVCDECGGTDVVFSSAKTFLPPTALAQMFERKGWSVHKRGKHRCPDCISKEAKITDAPREPAPKDNRKIIARLMEVYDDSKSRYCDGFTDNLIAKELGVPRKWVERLRDQNFGPSGRNAEMDAVASAIGQIHAEAKKVADDAMALAARAEDVINKADAMRAKLDELDRAVGPRSVA